jgi:hypothetical protein
LALLEVGAAAFLGLLLLDLWLASPAASSSAVLLPSGFGTGLTGAFLYIIASSSGVL